MFELSGLLKAAERKVRCPFYGSDAVGADSSMSSTSSTHFLVDPAVGRLIFQSAICVASRMKPFMESRHVALRLAAAGRKREGKDRWEDDAVVGAFTASSRLAFHLVLIHFPPFGTQPLNDDAVLSPFCSGHTIYGSLPCYNCSRNF